MAHNIGLIRKWTLPEDPSLSGEKEIFFNQVVPDVEVSVPFSKPNDPRSLSRDFLKFAYVQNAMGSEKLPYDARSREEYLFGVVSDVKDGDYLATLMSSSGAMTYRLPDRFSKEALKAEDFICLREDSAGSPLIERKSFPELKGIASHFFCQLLQASLQAKISDLPANPASISDLERLLKPYELPSRSIPCEGKSQLEYEAVIEDVSGKTASLVVKAPEGWQVYETSISRLRKYGAKKVRDGARFRLLLNLESRADELKLVEIAVPKSPQEELDECPAIDYDSLKRRMDRLKAD